MKNNITMFETKLAKFDKASAVLGISWTNIDRNFDWFADFKSIYFWLKNTQEKTNDLFMCQI